MRARLVRHKKLVFSFLALGLLSILGFFAPSMPVQLQPRGLRQPVSLRIVDRNGRLLRDVQSTRQGVAHWKQLSEISPFLVQATLCSEDQRFFQHAGVDPLAVLRAIRINWSKGRIVQGGSSITQQLVRNLVSLESSDPQSRGWRVKLCETYWALRLEWAASKDEILESYLNRIYYGNQCYGIEAAAHFYFGRSSHQLSLAQSAFLAILPRAPEGFLPFQEPEEVQKFQRLLLDRMLAEGRISQDDYQRACQEPLEFRTSGGAFKAGHFCDYVLGQRNQSNQGNQGEIRTTLDVGLQEDFEKILRTQIERLRRKNVHNGAVVALDLRTGEVLSMVGSTNYDDSQFNAALAGRQPGSTLKPFTYGLALERDKTAASILPDLNLYPNEVTHGYIPRNYDEKFHGPVRLRTALACSYNVPVVRVLETFGTDLLLRHLRELGFDRLTREANHYGLGLTLGDGEVSLLQLCNAYRCMARGGVWQAEEYLPSGQTDRIQKQVMDPRVCFILADILRDPLEREASFGLGSVLDMPFWCAVKTGTSKGYRDNWTVGFTDRYVVGVWVGNLDGEAMQGVSGVTGAAPIFRECLLALHRRDGSLPQPPSLPAKVVQRPVCPQSGVLAGPFCDHTINEFFLEEKQPTNQCSVHRLQVNGQLVPLDLQGPEARRWRHTAGAAVVLCYPPLYREWMREKGLAWYEDRAPSRPLTDSPDSSERVRILFPDGQATFRIDPRLRDEQQKIHFKGLFPRTSTRVEWKVDGQTVPSDADMQCWWTLQRGMHRVSFSAWSQTTLLGTSKELNFQVR